jgi:hypothetical protein
MTLPATPFIQGFRCKFKTGLSRTPVEIRRFRFALSELANQRLMNLLHLDGKKRGKHSVVDHVAHELAQLRIVANRRDDLIERHRVEMHVAAQLMESERLVVDHGAAAFELHHVFPRGFRIHRHQKIHFPAPRHESLLAGANREPGRQTGDVRRKHVFSGDRNSHLKKRPQKNGVRRLAAGSVNGRNLNTEVVYN